MTVRGEDRNNANMEACRSKTVDRKLQRPVWLGSNDDNFGVPKKPLQLSKGSKQVTKENLKATNLRDTSCEWMRFPLIKNSGRSSTDIRQEFERQNYSIRPRFCRLARRRDQIQIAPREVRSESRSLYQRNYEGVQNKEIAKAIIPVDEGLNGLETDVQLEMRKKLKQRLCQQKSQKRGHYKKKENADLITTHNVFMKDSVYRKDYCGALDLKSRDVGNMSSPNIPEKPLDMSTNYRSSYHSWVDYEDPECFTFCNWKPQVSVYISPELKKLAKMDFRTSYEENYRGETKDRVQPKRLSTCIDKFKLLNAVNGEPQTMPPSLYQDTYVPLKNVDNWASRNIHQNLKALSKQVGPSHDDLIYWKDVPQEPYQHYKKAVFARSSEAHDVSAQV